MSFLQSLDEAIFLFINKKLSNFFFDAFFPAITDLHHTIGFKAVFIPLLILVCIYIYRFNALFVVLGLSISLGLGDKIGSMAKSFWQRPRPFQNSALDVIERSGAGHFSFPSNHAVNMFCMAFFLSYFFPKFRWLFFTIAVSVSLSRIYNGVHYPFDVLAGAVLGSFVGILGVEVTKRIISKFETLKEKKNNHV